MIDRRHFVRNSCLIAGGSLLGPARFLFAESTGSRSVTLDRVDRHVLKFIGEYSGQSFLQGGCVAAKAASRLPGLIRITARVDDLNGLFRALADARRAGIQDVHAEGNTIHFALNQRIYRVDNLLPDLFAARLTGLATGKEVIFAHEALSFQPATSQLHDPLRAGNDLRLARGDQGRLTLEQIIEGRLAAHDFGLTPAPDFLDAEKMMLDAQVADLNHANEIVRQFLKNLVTFTQATSAEKVIDYVRSPLLASAFAGALSVDTASAAEQFARLRVSSGSRDADAVLWMAALLAPKITEGTATAWMDHASSFHAAASLAALARAGELV